MTTNETDTKSQPAEGTVEDRPGQADTRSEPIIELGEVNQTPAVFAAVSAEEMANTLNRHARGDWGTLDEDAWKENDVNVRSFGYGACLLSMWKTRGGHRLVVYTRGDRKKTNVMLANEMSAALLPEVFDVPYPEEPEHPHTRLQQSPRESVDTRRFEEQEPGRHFIVINRTDGIDADPAIMTLMEAKAFVESFPRRFEGQGYYLTASGRRIPAEEVRLEIFDLTQGRPSFHRDEDT